MGLLYRCHFICTPRRLLSILLVMVASSRLCCEICTLQLWTNYLLALDFVHGDLVICIMCDRLYQYEIQRYCYISRFLNGKQFVTVIQLQSILCNSSEFADVRYKFRSLIINNQTTRRLFGPWRNYQGKTSMFRCSAMILETDFTSVCIHEPQDKVKGFASDSWWMTTGRKISNTHGKGIS